MWNGLCFWMFSLFKYKFLGRITLINLKVLFDETIIAALAFQHNSMSAFDTSPELLWIWRHSEGASPNGELLWFLLPDMVPSEPWQGFISSLLPYFCFLKALLSSHLLSLSWACSYWIHFSPESAIVPLNFSYIGSKIYTAGDKTIFPCDLFPLVFMILGLLSNRKLGRTSVACLFAWNRTLTYTAKACFLCSPAGLVHATLQKASWTEWEK